jgi:putative heme-binding domain-containing protein
VKHVPQIVLTFTILLSSAAPGAAPLYLEDRFEMPPGFRIYRAAGPELSGGSYDLVLDGEGRLLVGDGTQVRRLTDRDGDGVFDQSEVIAGGLGPRGPQGLLLSGDLLYAVGGDGIQLFEGYRSGGPLVHRGRLGSPFGTGGDHDAHSVIRGHDGFLYFIAGDGSGTRDRRHITEESSPALFERSCTLFRISPDGKRWECLASGGRNAPNVGINYLGELFSLDSDMEWHVDLPWWRPVRLHHWIAGGDQGWQDVGAYPPYYLDNLPGILNVGRGSPDWGVFYEHVGFPEKYRQAYLVCDYQSKSATTGGYETSGRLFAFFLERDGAGWKASMEVLARPKSGARDASGNRINFALVDVEVAADGSLFLSDHNQGIWRIFYDPDGRLSAKVPPPIAPPWPPLPSEPAALLEAALSLPQPASERSRLREAEILRAAGSDFEPSVMELALNPVRSLAERLRAVRLLAPRFADLPQRFLEKLAGDRLAEARAQAAWLLGLRGGIAAGSLLLNLIEDEDPFVRRRAAEAFCRLPIPESIPPLIARLADPTRLVRYAAMAALAHHPLKAWFDRAAARDDPQTRMRALVAAHLRHEPPSGDLARRVILSLIERRSPAVSSPPGEAGNAREDRLDLLRVIGLYSRTLREDGETADRVRRFLLESFPDPDHDLRFELIRLLGEYRVPGSLAKLLPALEAESDPVEQFHLLQSLARIPGGFSEEEEERAARWVLGTQTGWFAQFTGKGLEFPHFLATVLSEFASHHREALLRHLGEVHLSSVLGGTVIEILSEPSASAGPLLALYRANEEPGARRRLLVALGRIQDPLSRSFLREEYLRQSEPGMRGAALAGLAAGPVDEENLPLLQEGLLHRDPDLVHACAGALTRYRLSPTEAFAGVVLGRMAERADLFQRMEKLLVASSGKERPGFRPDADPRKRPEESVRQSALTFWNGWYGERFGHPFDPSRPVVPEEKTDEEIRNVILEGSKGGDPARGLKVYEAARCASCHGGAGGRDERIFGPELAGVSRRLKPEEIADSLVYPSKQVADRFKAKVVQLKGEPPVTGFITEENDEAVTVVDQERVHRISRKKVILVAPQETSLMPERLLNRFSRKEIRDLMAYLEEVGARPDPPGPAGKG